MLRRRKLLGEALIAAGLITSEQLARAVELQQQSNERLGRVLVGMGAGTEKDLSKAIATQLNLTFADLDNIVPEEHALLALPEHLARRYQVIPLAVRGDTLTVGMVDPLDVVALDDVRHFTGREIEPMVISPDAFKQVLNQYPALDEDIEAIIKEIKPDSEEMALANLRALVDEAPVIRLVNSVVLQAIRQRASDIHIEPQATRLRIRYRIDGVLYTIMTPPKHLQAALISRVKIMAEMDIAEQRRPQDGRIELKVEDRNIDLRVNTIPTVLGESVAIRVLDKSQKIAGADEIGLLPDDRQRFEKLITKPFGIILLTGPTGSGKTTTMYTILKRLNSTERNIVTIEDPVEYQLPGLKQVQVNPKAGLTFANTLRSFLRQDPDIIMVGEIRDEETARIATHAALTGHLVLSTLHTNDAPGAVTRLIDMGIEPFLVASSLIGVIAQRLVRVLCEKCKQAHRLPAQVLQQLGGVSTADPEREVSVFRPRGCEFCNKIGYSGRTGLFETMLVDEAVRALITTRAPVAAIKQAAVQAGMRTLAQDGLKKVMLGITSPEELSGVVILE